MSRRVEGRIGPGFGTFFYLRRCVFFFWPQNPIRWPKDRAIEARLQHIVHAVEKNEWPAAADFSVFANGAVETDSLTPDAAPTPPPLPLPSSSSAAAATASSQHDADTVAALARVGVGLGVDHEAMPVRERNRGGRPSNRERLERERERENSAAQAAAAAAAAAAMSLQVGPIFFLQPIDGQLSFLIWTGTITQLVYNLKELLDTNIRSLMFQIFQ